MKIKTQDLTELQLDWAAAKANDTMVRIGSSGTVYAFKSGNPVMWNPSDSWAQGGPIIERERIELKIPEAKEFGQWMALIADASGDYIHRSGPTPLIAAMRCFIQSRLGDEVEIPEELGK